MKTEAKASTRGNLWDHILTPPALPLCFDSSEGVSIPPMSHPLDFVVRVNALAWGLCDEIYSYPSPQEVEVEWNNVGHTVPEILSKWRNYGLFGTNIEGWFTLDSVNVDHLLRAIALFGFVILNDGEDVKTLSGFHRNLGVSVFNYPDNHLMWGDLIYESEIYVVIPTIMVEADHPSVQYLKYSTLETE
jgi:hypothetical protein